MKKIIIWAMSIGLAALMLLFISTSFMIERSVKEKCKLAQEKYAGDCVESLSQVLDNEAENFRSRNSAVWALGQLGDKRAVSVLEKYYTGNIPSRESLDGTLSQYEIKKALHLIRDGFNATSFFWR